VLAAWQRPQSLATLGIHQPGELMACKKYLEVVEEHLLPFNETGS